MKTTTTILFTFILSFFIVRATAQIEKIDLATVVTTYLKKDASIKTTEIATTNNSITYKSTITLNNAEQNVVIDYYHGPNKDLKIGTRLKSVF